MLYGAGQRVQQVIVDGGVCMIAAMATGLREAHQHVTIGDCGENDGNGNILHVKDRVQLGCV